ncbi:hypothetical protein [Burkholderia pseudomallei]|uniref:hypothetical protein n=1 Tax=Burkholderia pseudomallei TaxID=28450 RepID=UPI00130E1070|nr:hypothetical protein [Burkholderia pseudomallei]
MDATDALFERQTSGYGTLCVIAETLVNTKIDAAEFSRFFFTRVGAGTVVSHAAIYRNA